MDNGFTVGRVSFEVQADTEKFKQAVIIEQLTAENKEMKQLLREIEYSDENLYCPCCGMGNYSGANHKPGCKLAKFIKE